MAGRRDTYQLFGHSASIGLVLTHDRAGVYEKFGDFHTDCFASASNSKGKKFYSKNDVPGTAGVNFFHQRCDVLVY